MGLLDTDRHHDPSWIREPGPPVVVNRPYLSPVDGRHVVTIHIDPGVVLIEADTRRSWGRAVAAIASGEPMVVTTQHPRQGLAEQQDQALWETHTALALRARAHAQGRSVVAYGPLNQRAAPHTPGRNPVLMWERHALTVNLINGWDRSVW